MLIYRLEEREENDEHPQINLGAYASNLAYLVCGDYSEKKHPNPDWDSLLQWDSLPDRELFFFGFNSLKQYHEWFMDWEALRLLDTNGNRGQLSVYEVPEEHIIIGERQLIFNVEYCERVQVLSCATLEHQLELL